jgi:hypothetical protein
MDPEVPELYTDAVQIGISAFGATLAFGMQPAGQTGSLAPIKVCNMRMSLEHAKVLSILLKKQIKNYETNALGEEIPLPSQLYQQLGLSKQEDW